MPDLITDATALKPRGEPGRTQKGAWTKGAPGTCPMFLWINKHLLVPGQVRQQCNDVQVIFLALLDYLYFSVQIKWPRSVSRGTDIDN